MCINKGIFIKQNRVNRQTRICAIIYAPVSGMLLRDIDVCAWNTFKVEF